MKIFPNNKPEQDKELPHADTCFFNVSLPAYSTLTLMKEKLLIAITHTMAMDGDTTTEDDGFGAHNLRLRASQDEISDDYY